MAEPTPGPARTKTRRQRPVDPAVFRDDVDAALDAFATDVCYAVAMARAAVTITGKRRIWQARRDLRTAEARAERPLSIEPLDLRVAAR